MIQRITLIFINPIQKNVTNLDSTHKLVYHIAGLKTKITEIESKKKLSSLLALHGYASDQYGPTHTRDPSRVGIDQGAWDNHPN